MKFNPLITLLSITLNLVACSSIQYSSGDIADGQRIIDAVMHDFSLNLVACSSIQYSSGDIADGQRIIDAVMHDFSLFSLDHLRGYASETAIRATLPPHCGPYQILDGQYFVHPLPSTTQRTKDFCSQEIISLYFEIVANNPENEPHYLFKYSAFYLNDEKSSQARSKAKFFSYTIKNVEVSLKPSKNTIALDQDGQVHVIVDWSGF